MRTHMTSAQASSSLAAEAGRAKVTIVLPSASPVPRSVLPRDLSRKTLVLDLDETLVHSTVRPGGRPDFVLHTTIDGVACSFFVFKRPHVDEFLRQVAQWFDVVIFTASLPAYAHPVIDALDPTGCLIASRFFRDSCVLHLSSLAKDMCLVRPDQDLASTMIVDNSPGAYAMHNSNAIPISTWMSGSDDEALLDLLPFLSVMRFVSDVRAILSLRLSP